MAQYKLNIITDINKLSERCDETDVGECYSLVRDVQSNLKHTLKAEEDLVSLCAPQIGKDVRLFAIKYASGKIDFFVNPMIIQSSKEIHLSKENNPSLPDKQFIIPRHNEVALAYQDVDKWEVTVKKFSGVPAEVVQQMVEMLDGILLSDYGLELIPEWDEATEEEKEQVVQLYLDNLKNQSKEAIEGIKEVNDNIETSKDILSGKTKPTPQSKKEEIRVEEIKNEEPPKKRGRPKKEGN